MADLNQQTAPLAQSPRPLEWAWIVQRQETDGQSKGKAVWKFGFISPDGAEVRVTLHQVGSQGGGDAGQQPPPPTTPQQETQQTTMAEDAMPPGATPGMPPGPATPSSDSPGFAPAGQPSSDQTENSTFYVTFFSNRNPEFFMKWDTSLSHEDSMVVWITVTHGIVDFVRKAKPANVILDDLANGKLKMVLRSVAMDVVAANPEYEIEQTQKHHYRTFFQVKKSGTQSAFDNTVSGNKHIEGDTQIPQQASPVTGGQAQVQAQAQQQGNQPQGADATPMEPGGIAPGDQKTNDPTNPQPNDPNTPEDDANTPQFASSGEIPIKQTATPKRGMTVEIGKDYSIAVKDKSGFALDRYRAKNPADILRWIHDKGYGGNHMKIVDREELSGEKTLAPQFDPNNLAPEKPEKNKENQTESFVVKGKCVTMRTKIEAKQAAQMNSIVNAPSVRLVDEGVEFGFDTDKDMNFKKALVELAAKRTGIQESLCYCYEYTVPRSACPTCSKK